MDILRVLVQNGADVNAKTEDNRTPLCLTTSRNSSQSKFLIKKGADVHHADERGRTALHEAGRSGWSEIVRMLIQSGADVNAVDKDNKTVLWYAAWPVDSDKSAACILHLVCGGAKIDEETIKRDKTGVLGLIEERLKLLRAGKRMRTSLMSKEESHFMWNLAFFFTIKHRVAAFKAYYTIRSFITYNGIFMAHGYDAGVESKWRKFFGEKKYSFKYNPNLEDLEWKKRGVW